MICLPAELVSRFKTALKDGTLKPDELAKISSENRRAVIEKVVGKDAAKDVNALFESKLALHDFQTGVINWAKEVMGQKPEVARDIISRVNKMTDLTPEDVKTFKTDLVAKKLGTEVTPEEAAKLAELGKNAADLRTARDSNTTPENIRAYGRAKGAFGDYLDSLKPNPNRTIGNTISNILNIPKSALTSVLHFSAAGVQLWGSITTPEFWKGSVEQFKYFASEENYKNAQADISGSPDYETAKRAGLGITSIDGKLNDREEAIQSSLLQQWSKALSDKTGLPDAIRASSRAFTGYLNYVRFGRFEDLMNAARLKGVDVSKGSVGAENIADMVNSFTGRGKSLFGIDMKNQQAMLNNIFFSPRKMAGAVDMFNPWTYLDPKVDPSLRIAMIKQLTGSLLVTGSLMTLAKLMGAKVQTNPDATDFGKIGIGNSTIDITGGNASYVRLVAQVISGKMESGTGKTSTLGAPIYTTSKTGKQEKTPFTAPTRADQALTYLRDHTSPVVATIWDWFAGSNVVGQPVTVKGEAMNELSPLVAQAFYDMYKNDPSTFDKVWPLLPAIFGFSTQSTAPTPPKAKK
jgi:hypothetical protein